MSQVAEAKVQQSEPLFTPKHRRLLTDPLDDNNPITVQALGVCSALAVTTQVKPALVMAISVVVVCSFANFIISALRSGIPSRIRMIVQLVVIASLVTLVDQVLKAFLFDLSKELSVYIGLIITNCIIMGRLDGFAMANKPWPSFLDGIGNGLGYGAILIIVAFFRELFGAGTVLGFDILTEKSALGSWLMDIGYAHNGVMVTPAAAMFLIGIIIWVQRARSPKLVDIS